MRKKWMFAVLTAALLIGLSACGGKKADALQKAQIQESLSKPYETTAKVKYHDFESIMTIYKKPMNCAAVQFESPKSLKDFRMTYYTDKVAVDYKDMHFDFLPDTLPGKAASSLVVSALNSAMSDSGVTVEQKEQQLLVKGELEEGTFELVIDRENGNILKLSIPASELEMEILNFKILE